MKLYNFIKHFIQLFSDYTYDAFFYLKNSRVILLKKHRSKNQLYSEIIKISHSLEKGLSFRNVKEGYGEEKANFLMSLLKVYGRKFNYDEYYEYGLKTLFEYYKFNKNHVSESLRDELDEILINLENRYSFISAGNKKRSEYVLSPESFLNFVKSRNSVRQFSDKEVPLETLSKALEIAQYAPSACNRQSIRAHIITSKEKIEDALIFQTGNRGFGHEFEKLLIITADIHCYGTAKERNLCYVDGGIFTMNLLFALQTYGISSCPLNWAVDFKSEINLRKVIPIPKNEKVVVMIGVGFAEFESKVAKSWRKPIDHIQAIHN